MKVLAEGYVLEDPRAGEFKILVDPDVVYPSLMRELGLTDQHLDHYWLTVIYQLVKLEAARLARMNGYRPQEHGHLQLVIMPARVKERWQLKRHPVGKGEKPGIKDAPTRFEQLLAKRQRAAGESGAL